MSNRRMGPAMMGPRKPINKDTVKRLLGYVKPYWPRLIVVLVCVILNAVATASAATFLGQVIDDHITPMLAQANPDFSGLLSAIFRMAALYLLAMLDYVSRLNGVPLCNEYDDLRRCSLEKPLYPASVLAICAASKDDSVLIQAERDAIPEFKRFNIIECEVRNAV